MRFSVIRIMANVVVAFMVLGYPGIGQAQKCGTATYTPQNSSHYELVCRLLGTDNTQAKAEEEADKRIRGKILTGCTLSGCSMAAKCPEKCKATTVTAIDPTGSVVSCSRNGKCDGSTDDRWDCSMTITSADCSCSCCDDKKRNKLKNTTQQSPPMCKPGEDCDVCDGPGLVDLDEFTATPQNNGISLTWTTKTELDSQGFRIWRGTPDLGKYCGCSDNMDDYKQITITTLDEAGNPTLIPATGSTTSGSNYAYLDKEVKPGIPYCYALEDIDSKGESKFYFEYISFTPDAELEKGTPE
jgi:hypothetical protein